MEFLSIPNLLDRKKKDITGAREYVQRAKKPLDYPRVIVEIASPLTTTHQQRECVHLLTHGFGPDLNKRSAELIRTLEELTQEAEHLTREEIAWKDMQEAFQHRYTLDSD